MNREIASEWRKSSYSDSGANCVETAVTPSADRAVRDSKDPSVGHLVVAAPSWAALTSSLRGRTPLPTPAPAMDDAEVPRPEGE
ncbi:DUF397 domain-containing protein [Embleya hyalina]|uniref:Toxin n=1 Tax=Embleya hyalina TaxID=516124 RepID=A0A401Z3I8_9ACTN|nr:DUF397 domain-containing protein [Embleya hyalina]GCE01376.1 toxin [Embleya hyalina]